MTFSVIIPAYNASRYIRDAIESVLRQDFIDWELVIINDGSVDNTQCICDQFAEKDSRIRVISKVNAGVSAARNDGIHAAKGDYLFFLDSDDKLGDNVIQKVNAEISRLDYQPDIVFGTYSRFDEHTGKRTEYVYDFNSDLSNVRGLEIWRVLYEKAPVFSCPIMTQIYRTAFLRDNEVFFDSSLFVSEDHDWRYLALTRSHYYYYNYEFFTYYYRESNTLSVTHTPMTYRKFANSHIYLKKWYNNAMTDNSLASIKEILLGLIGEDYANKAVDITYIADKQERRMAKKLFREDAYILKNARFKRYKLSTLVYRVFGLEIYLFLIAFRRKLLCN